MAANPDTPITLDEWRSRRHAEITRFVRDWAHHQDAKPEDWPNAMSPGDWDEQFNAFLSDEND